VESKSIKETKTRGQRLMKINKIAQNIEGKNEKKQEEVALNEEELKIAINKAVEEAEKRSREKFEKKKKELRFLKFYLFEIQSKIGICHSIEF